MNGMEGKEREHALGFVYPSSGGVDDAERVEPIIIPPVEVRGKQRLSTNIASAPRRKHTQ